MKYRLFTVLAALMVTGALRSAPVTAEPEKIDAPGIENFSRLDGTPGFAGTLVSFGGATQPSSMSWLKSEGFTTVVNLRLSAEKGVDVEGSRAAAEAAGLKYIHLPFNPRNLDRALVDDFLSVVGDKANQPVYIHCGSATRVAALWMIGRVLEDGWETYAAGEEAEGIAKKPVEAVALATRYLESKVFEK